MHTGSVFPRFIQMGALGVCKLSHLLIFVFQARIDLEILNPFWPCVLFRYLAVRFIKLLSCLVVPFHQAVVTALSAYLPKDLPVFSMLPQSLLRQNPKNCFKPIAPSTIAVKNIIHFHLNTAFLSWSQASHARSEERRVGKECRSRWSPYH